ncbi:glycosyltransferase family 4 protein [Massilia sp. YIM B02443]|uniref:glycosyltransferase family 4 protein n=1 Tax=Massilia sp. YIM B02443 TaxID=3050127 RepID=UPI0025B63AC4|nr:glycosyltransferase family 4 protein [Massilia sp. YIM B02443]MDN4036282.1 glycosyltransferase family 4 protein [Massilia sp. YIM B02443]
MRRLQVLTWHTHGSYLYYLSHAPHDFHVLSRPGRPPGYGGRCGHHPWGDNVHDLPAETARTRQFDCILFQDDHQWERDQYDLLTPAQRALPRIYLEHDPPLAHPTETRHPVDDPNVLLVHVTPYNALAWNSGRTPTRVIEHGVAAPSGVAWHGELARGLVISNNLARRGRRMGPDLFLAARRQLPLDLVGMASDELGGLGEVEHGQLFGFAARYRFLFSPIRYSSLGLSVIEAMMIGMPVVALATTEMATVIENGVSGFSDTRPEVLCSHMQTLLREPALARALGERGRQRAMERFSIERFSRDWDATLRHVTDLPAHSLRHAHQESA